MVQILLTYSDDILNVRIQTLGVTEHSFEINLAGKDVDWTLYDVGGAVGQSFILNRTTLTCYTITAWPGKFSLSLAGFPVGIFIPLNREMLGCLISMMVGRITGYLLPLLIARFGSYRHHISRSNQCI